MTAARKKVAETLSRVDVVIEVLDARLPEASANPMIRSLREFRQRPCLRVLNKADLADPVVTASWLDFYQRQSLDKSHVKEHAIALSCKAGNPIHNVSAVPKLCRRLAPHRALPEKPLRLMIMGIPNVGKSTLMNALLQKRIAAVGDEPAVTKSQQTLNLAADVTLTDTPGLMWPKIEYESDGYMLAASHAVGVNAVEPEAVACFLGGSLLAYYPALLCERYQISPESMLAMNADALLEWVGKRRGCVKKGGRLDRERAALVLLNDYRDGSLGRISLESPDRRARMLAEVTQARLAVEQAKTDPDDDGDNGDET
jgi:ribosome biogenesis GTPase A